MTPLIPARLKPGAAHYALWGDTPGVVAGRTVISGKLRMVLPYPHSRSKTALVLCDESEVERLDGGTGWQDVSAPPPPRPIDELPFYVQLAPLSERIDADWHANYSK